MKKTWLRLAITVTGVSAILGLAGCAPSVSAETGLTELTIGVLPSIESAPLFIGQEEGFFEEEGLRIRVASLASGTSELIDPVVSGTYDIAVSDMLTIMAAHEGGDDLKLIAPAGSATGDTAADFGAVIVNKDAPFQTLADLSKHVVGSNSLNDTNNTVLRSTMDEELGFTAPDQWGGSSSVQWKKVSFFDAAAELTKGTVHAAFLVEPYLTRALNGDQRVLSYTYSAFDPALDVNAYFTSGTFAAENPELLERFTRALHRSTEFAAEKPADVRSVMTEVTQTQWNERTAAVLPRYTTTFDLGAARRLAEEGVKYELLTAVPDFDAFILD